MIWETGAGKSHELFHLRSKNARGQERSYKVRAVSVDASEGHVPADVPVRRLRYEIYAKANIAVLALLECRA